MPKALLQAIFQWLLRKMLYRNRGWLPDGGGEGATMIEITETWLNRVMALPRINCKRSFSSNRFMSHSKRKREKREAKK